MGYICPGGPFGVNPVPEGDAAANNSMWVLKSGDSASRVFTDIKLADGTPVTSTNSTLRFAIANTQFCEPPIWEGGWGSGCTPVVGMPGKLTVKIPQDVMDNLRRGGYRFSLTAKDLLGNNVNTPVDAGMLVEYTVSGPNHNIPYKENTYQYE